ncbi:MAG: hypothetical protein R6V36_05485 [Psychroflexus sp.]
MSQNEFIKFVQRADPSEWCEYGNEIKETLDILWEQKNNYLKLSYDGSRGLTIKKPSISRSWLLLSSFAIENLLKSTVIYEHPEYISNGRLSSNLTHHRLTDLAEDIRSIKFSDEELELISELEECLPSWGRYPIPKKVDKLKLDAEIIASDDFKEKFDHLFLKLDLHIYESIKKGWSGPHGYKFRGSLRSMYEDLPEGHEKMNFEELINWREQNED